MKVYIRNIVIVWGVLVLTSGCDDYLNRDINTRLSQSNVVHSYGYSKQLLTHIYGYLSVGFNTVDGMMIANATDDAEFTHEMDGVQRFNLGTWNAYTNPDNLWGRYYTAIREANEFLLHTDSINLDPDRLNPSSSSQIVYQQKVAEIKNWRYEARFLRAFYYFQLVKRYGGVPLILDPLSLDQDYNTLERASLQACIDFIVAECDACAGNLLQDYDNINTGRVTRGAAMTLKSKVLLYAASELFNNPSWAGGYGNPELIALQGDRKKRWRDAADAAKAVIDLNAYSLTGDYRNLFNANGYRDAEVIFVRRQGASNSLEKVNYPIGFDLATGGTTPSQNLVDAYEMRDGSAFSWDDPIAAAHPYDNRDPRLWMTILTNNVGFKGRNLEMWQGGIDGPGTPYATKTGYYLRKYINESLDILQGRTAVHSWIFFRLAEVYLYYAEALNECDPGNPDIKIYIDKVRARSKMPGVPEGLSQDEMRKFIHHEYRVEFAFEDHRFWDLRRWMEAPQYLGAPLEGVAITKKGDGLFDYKKVEIEKRVFLPKMYLYPIPQSELNIAKGLVQNPLW